MKSNKLKGLIAFIPVAIFMLFLQSCEKDPMNHAGTTYNGPDLIEFAHVTGSLSRSVTTAATPKYDSVKVQLVGPQRNTATNVTFEVDASSTAVPATDYVFVTPASGTSVTIDANSSLAWVKIQFNKVTSTKTLKLNLVSGDNVQLSANYKSVTFSLK